MIMSAIRIRLAATAVLGGIGLAAAPLSAQFKTIDPDAAAQAPIDGDLEPAPEQQQDYWATPENTGASQELPADSAPVAPEWSQPSTAALPPEASPSAAGETAVSSTATVAAAQDADTTYREDDLIGAAQDVFGEGAEEVAGMIRKLLAEQGQPNAYIVGREAGGAFIVGARYGSGTLYHKVEGERPVYWTGPSIGFDAGANAGSTFMLVYNLYDTEQLYERYPSGEGQAYVVGGLTASYLRKGDIVLIPIRVGAGLRLGVNAGYMKFSKEQRWMPF